MIKPIPDFPEYWITGDGRVWSTPRTDRFGRKRGNAWLKLGHTPSGYVKVWLSGRTLSVHRLVLETFVGPCPEGMEACHNNGVRTDNRVENLRWDTHSANSQDAIKHGTHPGFLSKGRTDRKGAANRCNKLTEQQVRQLIYICRTGLFTQKEVAAQYGVTPATVSSIVTRKTWRHLWT